MKVSQDLDNPPPFSHFQIIAIEYVNKPEHFSACYSFCKICEKPSKFSKGVHIFIAVTA